MTTDDSVVHLREAGGVALIEGLNFTAMDFETANSFRGSPCSVGLVKVRDGLVVDVAYALTRAPLGFDQFERFNTSLHGIAARDVADAPEWPETLAWISAQVGADAVVCHNAGFDVGVIRYACAAASIPWPTLTFLCTLVTARHTLAMLSYRLPFVAAKLGVEIDDHHNAAADALTTAHIAIALASKYRANTLAQLASAAGVQLGTMTAGFHSGSVSARIGAGSRPTRIDVNLEADSAHPFFGRRIVFTGTLMSMRRQDAWDAVCNLGGTPTTSVSKHTAFLVSGDINPAVLAPGMTLTGRAAKAALLRAAGHRIELLTEDDFVRSI